MHLPRSPFPSRLFLSLFFSLSSPRSPAADAYIYTRAKRGEALSIGSVLFRLVLSLFLVATAADAELIMYTQRRERARSLAVLLVSRFYDFLGSFAGF